MFYLLSTKDVDVRNLLHSSDFNFKIGKYNHGSSKVFNLFDCEMSDNTAYFQSKDIIMFDTDRRRIGTMGIKAAISKD